MKKQRTYKVNLDEKGQEYMYNVIDLVFNEYGILMSDSLRKNSKLLKTAYNHIFYGRINNICCESQLLKFANMIKSVYDNKESYIK